MNLEFVQVVRLTMFLCVCGWVGRWGVCGGESMCVCVCVCVCEWGVGTMY